jgi:hypothetical protein
MSLEILVVAMLIVFSLILTVYNHRQAEAMRGIERVAQDYFAMQMRSARRDYAGSLETLNPLEWVSNQLSAGLPKPVQVVEAIRSIPEIDAVDLRTNDNRRVVVSIRPKSDIVLFDRRSKSAKKKSAADRIANFASRPLLTKSRWGWGVKTVEKSMSQADEFFDLEAGAVGKRFGVHWDNPTRLYFHVVE